MRRGRPKHPDILTPRQWQVLELLRQGLSNEQIASRLGLTLDGAKYHVSEILTKLGLSSREEAARWRPEGERRRLAALAPLAWLTKKSVVVKLASAGAGATAAGLVFLLAVALSNGPSDRIGPLGKITYVQDGNLWVKTLPNGPARQLTDDGATLRPQWSPSGEWIMFQRTPPADPDELGIYLIRENGQDERRVVSQGLAASSPREDVLAFTVPGSPLSIGADVLVVENADGSGRREVLPALPGGGTLDRRVQPAWSSDGAWIVFEEHHQDHQSPSGGYSYVGLRAVRFDGSHEHELWSGVVPPLALWSVGSFPAFLSLSPDRPEPADTGGLPTRLRALTTYASEGSGVRMLPYRDFMAMSPNGEQIALVAGVALESLPADPNSRTIPRPVDTQTQKSIVLMDLDTGAVRTLTDSGVVAVSPSWSPEGATIAYVARPDTGPVSPTSPNPAAESPRRLWTMAADGSNARQVPAEGADCRQENPLWSGDGEHLLFACLRTETEPSLWLVSASGGRATQVVDEVSSAPGRGPPPHVEGAQGHIEWQYMYDWWRP
jgi:Tol biopolymer transport system component/DNA-binding CsgD family transcriptional regulator